MEHPPAAEGTGGGPARVGVELRRRREALGLDLDDVAAAIRIPPRHLESIETSRHRALPARIYAIGFVRAYAEYLGVDPRGAVDRFKAEARELDARPVLVFPEPATEKRVPGGALVAVSVCAALAVYAVWYMQTAQHWASGDRVPEAPIQLAQDEGAPSEQRVVDLGPALAGRSDFVPPGEAAQVAAGRPGGSSPAQPVWRPLPLNEPSLPAVASVPAPSGPPVPRARPDPNRPAQPVPVVPQFAMAPTGSPAQENSVPAVTIEPRARQLAELSAGGRPGTSVRPSDSASAWMPVARPSTPLQVEAAVPGVAWAQVPAAGTGPVVLRAAEASWIEVRSDSGEVVHARLMKAGDSYEVPQRPGLKLTTGNAGGLDVTVGGTATPKLGARGAVMREISLEGPRLLSGTAANRN